MSPVYGPFLPPTAKMRQEFQNELIDAYTSYLSNHSDVAIPFLMLDVRSILETCLKFISDAHTNVNVNGSVDYEPFRTFLLVVADLWDLPFGSKANHIAYRVVVNIGPPALFFRQ
jgi:hypothetical protein